MLDDPGGSTSNGTLVQQYQLNGGANQKWTIQKDYTDSNGQTVDLIVNVSSGKVLDDPAFGTNPGTGVIQYQEQSAEGEPGLGPSTSCRTATTRCKTSITACTWKTPTPRPAMAIDIDQWTLNGSGTANQQWTLIAASTDGPVTYSVENASSGLCSTTPTPPPATVPASFSGSQRRGQPEVDVRPAGRRQ